MIATNLTFSGQPVHLVNITGKDVIFECKGVVGTYTQIKDFLINHKKRDSKQDFFFGGTKIQKTGKDGLILDCLKEGTIEEAVAIRKFAEEVLSDKVKDEDLAYQIYDILNNNIDSLSYRVEEFRDRIDRKLQAKNQTFSIRYSIMGFENEILVALFEAMTDIYGEDNFMETERGASGDLYPEIMKIEKPDGTKISIPMGKMRLPGFSRNAYIETSYSSSNFKLNLRGQIQKKFEKQIENIIDKTQERLAENSIYRNTIIDVPFEHGSYYPTHEPKFIDVRSLNRDKKLILSQEVQGGIMNVVGRIKDPDGCKNDGIDIKSTFLLSGIGGTGKTESMFREIAPVALDEGMTVLYIQDSRHYANLLRLAEIFFKRGWRIMLIIEDIDQAFDGERRDELQQNILNTLDGGYNKDMDLISLLTTNYEDKLSSFFIRRVTDIIHFDGMDEMGAKEFVHEYIPNEYLKSEKGVDYAEVYKAFVGIVPSLAKRIIDKTMVIRRAKGNNQIEPKDIIAAVDSFKRQEELSSFKGYVGKEDTFLGAFQKVFGMVGMNHANMQKILQHTYNGVDEVLEQS